MITAGWLIAGGLHQEALNVLVYFEQRRLFKPALPYLSLPNVDVDSDNYIQWFTQTRNGTNPTIQMCLKDSPNWEHNYMMLALIKYRRIQELCIERKKVDAKVMSFLMGTHPKAGCESPVQVMRRDVYAIRAITGLFNIKAYENRIKNLIQQVNTLLKTVHKFSPLIISCLRGEKLPEPEFMYGTQAYNSLPWEEQNHVLLKFSEIQNAKGAYNYYGCGWNQHQYRYVLEDFLREGTVQRDWKTPNNRDFRGGFQQANFDIDPSAGFQACDHYSFRCLMTPDSETLEHACIVHH